jgi:peroxiredoxin
MKRPFLRITTVFLILVMLIIIRTELVKIIKNKQQFYRDLSKFFQKRQSKKTTYASLNGKVFKKFELPDLTGTPWNLNKDKSDLKVLILFNVNDCNSCLLEHTLWQKIHEKFSHENVLVLGISHTKDIEDLLFFVEERNISFTVLHDPDKNVMKNLGINTSPLRILLNRDNKILEIERPDPDLALQKKTLASIRQYLIADIDKDLKNKKAKNGG